MKKFITSLLLVLSVHLNGQTICGSATENGVVTLTVPAGHVIISISFASYGTPNGSCGGFTLGGCHAANSLSIIESTFIGRNSASIGANNVVFGDPCGGTVKRLYIEAVYSFTLPLTLVSFGAEQVGQSRFGLTWTTDNEVNTSHFIIERSSDGSLFDAAGSVAAAGTGGGIYHFLDTMLRNTSMYFYRLKMVDMDGRWRYSNILRAQMESKDFQLSLFPNPGNGLVTVTSSKEQELIISNFTGEVIKRISMRAGSHSINTLGWPAGLYFFRTETNVVKFVKM